MSGAMLASALRQAETLDYLMMLRQLSAIVRNKTKKSETMQLVADLCDTAHLSWCRADERFRIYRTRESAILLGRIRAALRDADAAAAAAVGSCYDVWPIILRLAKRGDCEAAWETSRPSFVDIACWEGMRELFSKANAPDLPDRRVEFMGRIDELPQMFIDLVAKFNATGAK